MSDLKTYVIRPGATFLMPDQTLRTGGDKIELPSDVATAYASSVDLFVEPEPEASAATVDLPVDPA